jgi:signal peptidase I
MPASRDQQRLIGLIGFILISLECLLWWSTGSGNVSYVSTRGSSMAPAFHEGDLAVVRRSPSYRVGEVVAYRSSQLGSVVLHRIVGETAGHYLLQGDRNTWIDPDRPTRSDIVGAIWLHIPHAGGVVGALRQQLGVLLAVVLLAGGGATAATRRRRGHGGGGPPVPAWVWSRLHAWRAVTLACSVTTVVLSLVGFVAFTRPEATAVEHTIPFTQHAAFSYRSTAPKGPTYPSGRVVTGDPIYLRLVPAIDLAFDYSIDAELPVNASGTVALDAVLADGTGWQQRVRLHPATSFLFDRARVEGHLDVGQLQAILAQVRADTGIQGGSATVTVLADVHLDATIGDRAVTRHFRPELAFRLDPLQMHLVEPSSTGAPGGLRPTVRDSVSSRTTSPARLVLLGRHLPVGTGRRLGLVAMLAALATLVSADRLRRRLRAEPARIELRHGRRIVPVAGVAPRAVAVDVTSMQDLARLAEQEQRLILHHRGEHGDVYLLRTDRAVYRYTSRPDATVESLPA